MNRPSIIPFLESPSEATFTPVFEEQRNLVFRICLKLLGSPEDAEEAFQATWARLLFVARNPVHRPAIGAEDLVARLAVMEADALRKRRNRRAGKEVAMGSLPEESTPAVQAEVVYTRELAEALELSVGELPDSLRDAATLHYLSGLSQRQVAAALKLPEGTVATRLRSAKQKLAEALRRRGIVNSDGTLAGAMAAAVLIVAPASLRADTCFSAATAAQAGLATEYATIAPGGFATLSAGVKLAGIAAVAIVLVIIAAYTLREPEPQPIPPASVASMDVADAPTVRAPEPPLPVADPVTDDAPQVTPSPAPDSATPPVFTVRGVIRDTAGQPIRDAEVVLEMISVEEGMAFDLVTLTTTRSRANGSYEASTTASGLYVVGAWKEGYSRVREHLVELDPVTESLAEQGAETVRNLVLPAESQLTALVRTEDGSAVSGARVYILQSSPGDGEAVMPVRHEGWTDDEGRFHVRGAARTEGRVIVIAAGHPRGYAVIGPTDHEVIITMSDEYYPLIGRVVKSDGTTPLEGARVRAASSEEATWHGLAPREETWTDAAGSFAFSALPATDHSFTVHLPGYRMAGDQSFVYTPLLSLIDEEFDLTITMYEEEPLQYLVIDQGTDEPLEGVRVTIPSTVAQLLSVEPFEALTDADGVFTGNLPPMNTLPGMLTLEKEGYVPLELTEQKEGEPVRFFMMRSVEVSGKVMRAAGDPVSAAQLYVSYRRLESKSGHRGLHQMGAGEAGSDGTFRISVPHDAEFTLLVREGNREIGRWGPATMTESPAKPVVITINDPVIAEAIVVNEADEPIANAKVTMTTFLRDQGMGYTSTQYVGSDVFRTDPFGRFRTEVASLDNVSVTVEAEGYAIVEHQMLSSTEINRIVMRPAGLLRGRVVDEHGNGLAGFQVSAYDATHQNRRNTTSGSDGRFVIEGIVAGSRSINITARMDNLRGSAENLTPGPEEHIVQVQTEGLLTLLGSVVDKNTGELLTISRISTDTGQSRVREKGFFSVDGLRRGEHVLLQITPEGYPQHSVQWIAPTSGDDGVIEETFELEPGGRAIGRVLSADDGMPISNAQVRVHHRTHLGGHGEPVVHTDSAGRFRTVRIEPGERHMSVVADNGRFVKLEVEFRAGEEKDLGDIQLPSGDLWAVRLVDDASGRGITGVGLRLTFDPQRWTVGDMSVNGAATTDADGVASFSIPSNRIAFVRSDRLQVSHRVKSASLEAPHEIRIGPHRLSGRVVYREQPAQASVRLMTAEERDPRFETATDRLGEFNFTNLPPGEYVLRASLRNMGNVYTVIPVTIPSSGRLEVLIPFTEQRGVVLKPDGSPAISTGLRLEPQEDGKPRNRSYPMWTNTGIDGSFTFTGFEEGRYTVTASQGGKYIPIGEFEGVTGKESAPLELVLPD